ncbi:MAG: hypothetical protein ACI9FO_000769 [Methylophagaceae bacterium]|jgi:hypothetical protein
MSNFMQVLPIFYFLKIDIGQRFTISGGRSSTKSQRDSMEKLESRYDR